MANPTLDEVATLADWFGHPDNNIFDGMTLTSLNTYNPAVTMATLVSLKPMAPLAFLGLFPSAGALHRFARLLMFPWACPCILGTLSLFDTGLCAYSNKVAGGSSPMVSFLTWPLILTMTPP